MHFTLLTQYYPPETGAPQARLSELAAHFVQRGHFVTVLTAMPNYPSGRIHAGYGGILLREYKNGVNLLRTFIYPTQKTSFPRRLTNYLSFVASSAIIGSLLLKRNDYLFVESPPLFLGLSGIWLSKLTNARLIFNVSDLWPESAVKLGLLTTDSLFHKASAWLERFCYKHAWLISGQSRSILTDINRRFPRFRTFHLSNGVDTRLFGPNRRTDHASAILNGNGKSVVLYAGLHGLAQGLVQVLEAAETLREESALKFAFIGDGPEKKHLLEYARRNALTNVHFLEPRPAREIPALLAAADIVIVPLKLYIPGAVPSKLYEAMASGRPVVLIAEGEAADIVRQHDAGIVVRPGDIKGVIEAVYTLHMQPLLRQTLGSNGRRAAEQHFDRTAIATRFIMYLEANL